MTGNPDIGLPTGWRDGAVAWAQKNDSVRELWLFGSRANGIANAGSDVDIRLVLMPAKGKHDWALGNYGSRHEIQVISDDGDLLKSLDIREIIKDAGLKFLGRGNEDVSIFSF